MNSNRFFLCVCVCALNLICAAGARAQQAKFRDPEAPSVTVRQAVNAQPQPGVPRLVKYSGALKDAAGQPRSGTVGITFSIYAEQEGGATLWLETQNAELDEQGRYTVLLGAQTKDGLPLELFTAGEARWLGVQVNLPGEVEQPRVLLVSVPYALKAADAETLGGKPATDYLLRAPLATGALTGTGLWQSAQQAPGGIDLLTVDCTTNCTTNFLSKFSSASNITSSILFDTGAEIGINTTAPSNVNREIVSVNGNLALFGQQTHQIRMSGTASSGRLGQDGVGFFFATDTAGKSMRILTDAGTGLTAWLNVYGNGNVGIGTAEGVPTAHKLEVAGGNLKLSTPGAAIIFPDGTTQTSAATGGGGGTITGVTAGTGLTGGGAAGGVTLSLNTAFTDARYAALDATTNTFTGSIAATAFSGNGSSLTNLNAGNLVAGTLPDARISGNYSSAVTFSNPSNLFTGSGAGLTNMNAATVNGVSGSALAVRGVTYVAGCDNCGLLVDADSQRMIYQNVIGSMTITNVSCFSDAGSPEINVQRDNGTPANILAANLTCAPTGASTTSFVTGQNVLSLGDNLNFVVVSAGGVARRVTLVIRAVVN